MSQYLLYRQQLAQGLIAKEGKKAPGPKKKAYTGLISLDEWFLERRKEMTGKCLHCGGRSCKHDDMYFKHSIAHLMPKNLFDSIKTHPLNWIELCFWEKNCHGNMDAKILDIIDLNCFDLVIERFVIIYPAIAPAERKYIPDVLLQYAKDSA